MVSGSRSGSGWTSGRTWSADGDASGGLSPTGSAPERYELRALIGQGAMGRVWLAWDRELEREVAYKELVAGRAGTAEARRFLHEAQLTGRLEHPGIVPVHDAGERPDGGLYYVMRVLRGRSLAELMGPPRAERSLLLDALIDACQAVAYAHSHGVVHRDLKPENIMTGAFGEAIVVDWGLAKVLGSAEGEIVGTPHYMSPEQARGLAVDTRSDVWSIGVVLYELLAGRCPFEGEDALSVLAAVCLGEVPPLEVTAPDAPPELVAVARRALAPRSEDRYPDAGALVADLRAWRTGRMVSAYSYSPLEQALRLLRRYRWPLGGLGVGLTVAVLAAAIGFVRTAQQRDRAVAAELDARSAEAAAVAARAQTEALLQRIWVGRAEEAALMGDAAAAMTWAGGALALGEELEARGVVARFVDRMQFDWSRLDLRLPGPCRELTTDGERFTCAGPEGAWAFDGARWLHLDDRPSRWVTTSADGRYVAASGTGWLRVVGPDGAEVLRRDVEGTRAPRFDGDTMLWGLARSVRATDLVSGTDLWTRPTSSLVGGTAARDGHLWLWQANGSILELDARTGALPMRAVGFNPRGMYIGAFSPTEPLLTAFATLGGGVGWMSGGGELHTLRERGEVSSVGWSADGRYVWSADPVAIRVWALDGTRVLEVPAPSEAYSVAMGSSGSLLVALGQELFVLAPRDPAPHGDARVAGGVGHCAPRPSGTFDCSLGSGDAVTWDPELGRSTLRERPWLWGFDTVCPIEGDVVLLAGSRIAELEGGRVLLDRTDDMAVSGTMFACGRGGTWAGALHDHLIFGRDRELSEVAAARPFTELGWWQGAWLRGTEAGWERWTTEGAGPTPVELPSGRAPLASPADRRLALLTGPRELSVLDASGTTERTWTLPFDPGPYAWADESLLVVADTNVGHVWDVDTGREVAVLAGHAAPLSWLGGIPGDRTRFVTADHEGHLIGWNLSVVSEPPDQLAARVGALTGYRVRGERLELAPP